MVLTANEISETFFLNISNARKLTAILHSVSPTDLWVKAEKKSKKLISKTRSETHTFAGGQYGNPLQFEHAERK